MFQSIYPIKKWRQSHIYSIIDEMSHRRVKTISESPHLCSPKIIILSNPYIVLYWIEWCYRLAMWLS